jgi:hypothetical protein
MRNFTIKRLKSFKPVFVVVLFGVTSQVTLNCFGAKVFSCGKYGDKSIGFANFFTHGHTTGSEFDTKDNFC